MILDRERREDSVGVGTANRGSRYQIVVLNLYDEMRMEEAMEHVRLVELARPGPSMQ